MTAPADDRVRAAAAIDGAVSADLVSVSLLGPVTLHLRGTPIAVTGKRGAVLAMLALDAGRVLSVDRLIDGVWGDDSPPTVRASLQVQVSQLRRLLAAYAPGEVIVTRPPGYVLEIEPAAVDAIRLAQLVAEARRRLGSGDIAGAADTARDAVALWGGEPFGGLGDAPFCGPVATRLGEQRLDALEVWADAEIACGFPERVIVPLEELVAHSPYRETLWQRLILALYRCGRQVDALQRLAVLRAVLRDDLGVRPSAVIVELETAILEHDNSLDVPAPLELPARLSGPGLRLPATKHLVGRDTLIAEIKQRCADTKLVTLTGPGGVGKTSVAVNIAASCVDENADGVWFVDLSRVSDDSLVATALGAAVGLHPGEAGLPIGAVVELLLDADALLVLDNCEHVIEAAASAVAAIISSCHRIRILATSRERLGVADEAVVVVSPLETVDAVELLGLRARRVGVVVERDDASDVAAICRAVDHLPLGIELVAARLQTISVADIAARLDADSLLRIGGRGGTERQRSLQHTIQWSYDLLSVAGKVLLRRLSVFEGGAGLDSVIAVCADPNGTIDGDPVTDVLDAVVRASLVAVDRSARRPRYRLLDTVKAFVRDQLEDAELAEVQRRHAVEMIDLGTRLRVAAGSQDPLPAFNAIQLEAANFRAAFRYSTSSDDCETAARIVGGPGPLLWRESGAIHELDEWVEQLLTGDELAGPERLSVLMVGAFRPGVPIDCARQWADEAVQLAVALDDDRSAAFASFLQADVMLDEMSPRLEALFQSAIERLEASGQGPHAGQAINSYANALLRQLRLDDADALLRPRLGSSDVYGVSEAYLLYQHARLLLMTGDIDGASAGMDDAMRQAARCGVPMTLSYCWFGKALLAEARNDPVAARSGTSAISCSAFSSATAERTSMEGSDWCRSASRAAISPPHGSTRRSLTSSRG